MLDEITTTDYAGGFSTKGAPMRYVAEDRLVTQEELRRRLAYDAATGIFTWRVRSSRGVVGAEAGSVAPNGYRYIYLDGLHYIAGRLAWFYVHGEWPHEQISYRDGDRLNVRAGNLLDQAPLVTARTRRVGVSNTSGHRGVSYDDSRKKWSATISRNYQQVLLGRFNTKEEAAEAYDAAASATDPEDIAHQYRVEAVRRRTVSRMVYRRSKEANQKPFPWKQPAAMLEVLGEAPTAQHMAMPADETKPIAADNFKWVDAKREPLFDYSTAEGRAAYQRAHKSKNVAQYKNGALKAAFGIDLARYSEMLQAQAGVCSICGKPEKMVRRGKLQALCVDHCHETGAVRDLLCHACNHILGASIDDPATLRKAADYLERHALRIASDAPTKGQN